MTMTTITTASQTWSPLGPTTAGWSPTPPRRTGTVSGLGPGLPSARLAVAHLYPGPASPAATARVARRALGVTRLQLSEKGTALG